MRFVKFAHPSDTTAESWLNAERVLYVQEGSMSSGAFSVVTFGFGVDQFMVVKGSPEEVVAQLQAGSEPGAQYSGCNPYALEALENTRKALAEQQSSLGTAELACEVSRAYAESLLLDNRALKEEVEMYRNDSLGRGSDPAEGTLLDPVGFVDKTDLLLLTNNTADSWIELWNVPFEGSIPLHRQPPQQTLTQAARDGYRCAAECLEQSGELFGSDASIDAAVAVYQGRAESMDDASAQQEPVENQSTSNERKAFEKWWPSVGQTIGEAAAWEAWQARATRCAPAPQEPVSGRLQALVERIADFCFGKDSESRKAITLGAARLSVLHCLSAKDGVDIPADLLVRDQSDHAEALANLLEEAVSAHGVLLLSYPPQEAWEQSRINDRARELISAYRASKK